VDRTRLLSSFREIADILTEHGDKVSDGTAEEIARAVLRMLESKTKWLLIFDNLDNIHIADGYLPRTHRSGHVLITTRNKNCDGIPAEGVEINLLNSNESISLLLQRSGLGNRLGNAPSLAELEVCSVRTSRADNPARLGS